MLEIKPHSPVNQYLTDSFPKNGFMEFLDMLKAWFNEIDWDQYATKEELQELALKVAAIEVKVGEIDDIKVDIDDIRGDIAEIRTIINNFKLEINARVAAIEAMLNDPITVVQTVFTNPDYFYASDVDSEYYSYASTMDSVVCSFTGKVLQSVQVADNTLEVVNIQLDDNVPLDLTKTPNHFYTPMCVEHFDAQGNFTDMQTCMLDCELTQEMSGYDISCYFHGNIANVNDYTKFHFSLDFPYIVERSNNV